MFVTKFLWNFPYYKSTGREGGSTTKLNRQESKNKPTITITTTITTVVTILLQLDDNDICRVTTERKNSNEQLEILLRSHHKEFSHCCYILEGVPVVHGCFNKKI